MPIAAPPESGDYPIPTWVIGHSGWDSRSSEGNQRSDMS